MKDFMLLFRFPVGNKFYNNSASPEEFQTEALNWQKWMEGLVKDGRITPGQQLSTSVAKVISGSKKVVQDGPFAEGKEIVGNHCTIKARDLSEALEIAKGCPVLDQDGSVEVRGMTTF